MPDMEYWKQRARDAENKLIELGHKGVDKAKDLTSKGVAGGKRAIDMSKAKVGIDNDEPILPQIGGAAKSATNKAGAAVSDSPVGTAAAGARRGVDMGLTMGGANLDEPLLPQAADAVSGLGGAARPTLDAGARAIGKGIDAVGDTVTKTIPGAIAGGAGDLKNLFLDKMLGQSGGQPPHMYQGAPDAPPSAPSPYGGDQTTAPQAPSMYGTGQETVGQQPPPNAPSMYGTGTEPNPQPSMYGTGQEAQPYMYNNQPPTVMQRGGNAVNQGRHMMQNAPEHMERALKAAEDAYHRTLEHLRGGGQ
jgi:hypothetical protein